MNVMSGKQAGNGSANQPELFPLQGRNSLNNTRDECYISKILTNINYRMTLVLLILKRKVSEKARKGEK